MADVSDHVIGGGEGRRYYKRYFAGFQLKFIDHQGNQILIFKKGERNFAWQAA